MTSAGRPLCRVVVQKVDLDTAGFKGRGAPFPTLSDVFAGLLLTTTGAREQVLVGIALLRQTLALGVDPFGQMPTLPEWAAYLSAKRANDEQVRNVVARAQPFATRGGRRGAFLDHTALGGTGALYQLGYAIAVLYAPAFGDPPVPKYTIAGNGVRVDGLLPALNQLEPGWGGPSHGTIVGSPRMGSRLTPDQVVALVREHL